jgi:hypothetical protein
MFQNPQKKTTCVYVTTDDGRWTTIVPWMFVAGCWAPILNWTKLTIWGVLSGVQLGLLMGITMVPIPISWCLASIMMVIKHYKTVQFLQLLSLLGSFNNPPIIHISWLSKQPYLWLYCSSPYKWTSSSRGLEATSSIFYWPPHGFISWFTASLNMVYNIHK